jgi:hypothetical protein
MEIESSLPVGVDTSGLSVPQYNFNQDTNSTKVESINLNETGLTQK